MKRTLSLLLCLCLLTVLTVSAAATGYTPSVTQTGTTATAVVTDANGNTVEVAAGDLIVTPASEKASADPAIQEVLEAAEEELGDAAPLSSVLSSAGISVQSAVVGDIVDVTATGTVAEALENGATVTVTFTLSSSTDNLVAVLHKVDGVWQSEPYSVTGSNTVSVTVSSLSPFAFVYDSEELSVADASEGAPTSPKTGETLPGGIVAAGAAIALLAAGTVVLYKKKIA